MFYLLPLAALLGAFGRRAAGGVLNQWTGRPDDRPLTGDLPTRLLFGVCLALCALMGGALWWQACLLVPAVWVGTTLGSFHSVDMARGEDSFAHDWFGISAIALGASVLPAVVVAIPDWHSLRFLWIVGSTLMAAPAYWLGWCIGGAHGRKNFPVGLRGGMELGEAFWGAIRGIGILVAFS